MTVLDAYAVIAYLRGEPAGEEVADLLREDCVLSAANAAEVVDQLVRVLHRDLDVVYADLGVLAAAGLRLEPVTPEVGLLAGRLRAAHYDRQRSALSLADCLAGATALLLDAPLATSDRPLADAIRAEGGQVRPLPDSTGTLA